MVFTIIRPTLPLVEAWVAMRLELWPDHTFEELRVEAMAFLSTPDSTPVFLCLDDDHKTIGFLEGSVRVYAEGCSSERVGYVEGWFVAKEIRGVGIGALLMGSFFEWCKQHGIHEAASDTWLWNEDSIKAHVALGFTETERLVHFRKNLLQ